MYDHQHVFINLAIIRPFQITANCASLDKLDIGKPVTTTDATNGYMGSTGLASCVAEAYAAGWGIWWSDGLGGRSCQRTDQAWLMFLFYSLLP
ncbi:glycoside hydrolase family 18 protein [Paxillus rubicundulus Ve08.2h10]|uniref:Glycoside hydrolase family 18 protein n=1 Tax=Paxillus rubicundulus Ve08.2h10 TaxID=930991 RepID=A0A0D0EAA7_9AGAM|nr:glycoside hydrolase family 18 protein [Paxillus rubicundulus Ve08.2h10]